MIMIFTAFWRLCNTIAISRAILGFLVKILADKTYLALSLLSFAQYSMYTSPGIF